MASRGSPAYEDSRSCARVAEFRAVARQEGLVYRQHSYLGTTCRACACAHGCVGAILDVSSRAGGPLDVKAIIKWARPLGNVIWLLVDACHLIQLLKPVYMQMSFV